MRYYGVMGVTLLVYAIIDFSILKTLKGTCERKCPLEIQLDDSKYFSPPYNYHPCACRPLKNGVSEPKPWLNVSGYAIDTSIAPQTEAERYDTITSYTRGSSGVRNESRICFICSNDVELRTVYEDCDSYGTCTLSGLSGFKPGKLSDDTYCNSAIYGTAYPTSVLDSSGIFFRSFVTPGLYIIAVILLIMSIASTLLSLAYSTLKDKNEADWRKLTFWERAMGMLCKELPLVVRVLNIFVICFIAFGLALSYAGVCEYETNDVGEIEFYPRVQSFLWGCFAIWVCMFVLGTIFHRIFPPDTALQKPKPAELGIVSSHAGDDETLMDKVSYCASKCFHDCLHRVGP